MWSPELLHWPTERERRARLAERGIPRLLVVADGENPPTDLLDDEDWIRQGAGERDVTARLENLGRRWRGAIRLHERALHTSRGVVRLTEREEAVMAVLLDHRGNLVPCRVLADVLATTCSADRRLHDAVHRLRRQLRPLGLDIYSTRQRGYTLGLCTDDTDR